MNTDSDRLKAKNEPELLKVEEDLTYDIDDVDGKMFMLDHSFSGCLVLSARKKLDERIIGKIFFGEKEIGTCIVKCVVSAGGAQFVGLPVRSILADYDTDYVVRVFIRDLINIPEAYNHIQFQTLIFTKSSFAVQCTCKGGLFMKKTKTIFGIIGI